MNDINFKEIWKKCFGKEKDTRWHAVAMLIIYFIFVTLVVGIAKTQEPINKEEKKLTPQPTANNIVDNNNYSYTYTITMDDETEVYIGKKYDNKEMFTLVKNGENKEYAILNNNYLELDEDAYIVSDNLDTYFKYCDKDKILSLIDYDECVSNRNTYKCEVDTNSLASIYGDTVSNDSLLNRVTIVKDEKNIKSINLELNNYISNLEDSIHTLTINMNFTDIGTTNNFDIKVK